MACWSIAISNRGHSGQDWTSGSRDRHHRRRLGTGQPAGGCRALGRPALSLDRSTARSLDGKLGVRRAAKLNQIALAGRMSDITRYRNVIIQEIAGMGIVFVDTANPRSG